MDRRHYEGFEKEERFHLILQQAMDHCPTIKARAVKMIIAHVAPKFLEGLFAPRPCVRKLRYVGCGNVCCEFATGEAPHGKLIIGHTYKSETFNGAVYMVHGREVGAAHFVWVRDEG